MNAFWKGVKQGAREAPRDFIEPTLYLLRAIRRLFQRRPSGT